MLRLPHPPAAAPTSAGNQRVQNWFPSHNLPDFTPKLKRILRWTVAVRWLEMLSKRGEKYFDEIKYCPWFPQLGNRAWQAARFWLCRCRRPSSFPLRPPSVPPSPLSVPPISPPSHLCPTSSANATTAPVLRRRPCRQHLRSGSDEHWLFLSNF